MASKLITLPFRPTINLRGGVEAGAKLFVYSTGTTTPVSVYSDSALTTPLANPVVANAFGVFPDVYYNDAQVVRVVMQQANGTVLSDTDPYISDTASAEASADAAATSAAAAEAIARPIYADNAAGLAATAEGDFFFVDQGDGTADLYRHDAGPTATAMGRTTIIDPQASGTAELIGKAGGGTVQDAISADALPYTQRLMERLTNDDDDCAIVVFSDSTGNETSEWVYRVTQLIAARFPTFTVRYRLWDDVAGTYAAATTIQTGTGANALTVWNAAIPGTTPGDWIGGRFSQAILTRDPDLVFTNFGHNGGSDPAAQVNLYQPLLARIANELPDVPVIVIGQNPNQTDDTMAAKVEAFQAMASRMNCGFINVHAAFRQSPSSLASLMADNVHPNAAGSALWAETVEKSLYFGGAASASTLGTPCVVVAHHSFADFENNWTISGAGLTLSRDTTNFETAGEGTKLTNTAGASGNIVYELVNSQDVVALRNQWVTFAVRLRFASGDSTTGRIGIFDDTTSVTSASGGVQTGGFYWQLVSVKVSNTATRLRGYIYAATSSSAGEVTVDRAILIRGMQLIDAMPPPRVEYMRALRVLGSNDDGVVVLRNGFTGARALSFLSTSGGADTDDPATQYTLAFGGDTWGWKARGDTHLRASITNAESRINFGSGSAVTDMYIGRNGSGLMAVAGAHLYPDADASFDIGLSNKKWRRAYVGEVWVNAIKVLGAQGAAIADVPTALSATAADNATAINLILSRLRAHGLIAT